MGGFSGNLFGKLFKKNLPPEQKQEPAPSPEPIPALNLPRSSPLKKGDFIGQDYLVLDVLGRGGFGVVALVYSRKSDRFYALKTFLEEFLTDREVRQRFQKEAGLWVELGRHPYLVRAHFVEELSGRLYIAMEYIAPNEAGINSLEGYLQRQPPDLTQSLRWAIQVCHGMEYAYSKGVRAHRDLKPANILVSQDMTVKITDFGLAGVIGETAGAVTAGLNAPTSKAGFSFQTMAGKGFGTPTHMPPEQFENAAGCDERSDLYSFGVILYQMASGGRLPFLAPLPKDGSAAAMAEFWQGMYRLHRQSPPPPLESPLMAVIQRCLEKQPEKRYSAFREVRAELETLLQQATGESITPPQLKEQAAWELINKAVGYTHLGRFQPALDCFDHALQIDPGFAVAWSNKGGVLETLGRHAEAILCFDRALEISPRDASTWTNRSICLDSLGRHEEAASCLEQALNLDPGNAMIHYNKGRHLTQRGQHDGAISFFDRALALDPQLVNAWVGKGACLAMMGRSAEAADHYYKALSLDPLKTDAWINLGKNAAVQQRHQEAIRFFDKALEIDRQNGEAWTSKASCLSGLKNTEAAVRCYSKALEINPQNTGAWIGKALSEDELDRFQEAARSYRQFLSLVTPAFEGFVQLARQRLMELESHVDR